MAKFPHDQSSGRRPTVSYRTDGTWISAARSWRSEENDKCGFAGIFGKELLIEIPDKELA